jgi:hypothetical protein
MVGTSPSKKQALDQVERRIRAHAQEHYSQLCISMKHDAVEAVEVLKELEGLRGTDAARPASGHAFDNEEGFKAVEDIKPQEVITDLEKKLAACDKPADPVQVEILRESFMRIVRGRYWELCNEGKIPQTSPAFLKLLNAVSANLDKVDQPLHDWAILEPGVKIVEGGVVDKLLDFMDKCLPEQFTIDNELHYYLKVKAQEEVYHTCVSYIVAHTTAQEKLAYYFGDDPEADTPEEITVILESARMVQEAKARLDGISGSLIELIKSSVVTSMIFESLTEFVHKLIEEGMLNVSEAEEMTEKMHKEEKFFLKAVKQKTRTLHDKIEEEVAVIKRKSSRDDSGLNDPLDKATQVTPVSPQVTPMSPRSQASSATPVSPKKPVAETEDSQTMPGQIQGA